MVLGLFSIGNGAEIPPARDGKKIPASPLLPSSFTSRGQGYKFT